MDIKTETTDEAGLRHYALTVNGVTVSNAVGLRADSAPPADFVLLATRLSLAASKEPAVRPTSNDTDAIAKVWFDQMKQLEGGFVYAEAALAALQMATAEADADGYRVGLEHKAARDEVQTRTGALGLLVEERFGKLSTYAYWDGAPRITPDGAFVMRSSVRDEFNDVAVQAEQIGYERGIREAKEFPEEHGLELAFELGDQVEPTAYDFGQPALDAAEHILNFLGIGAAASKEPGADRRRERVAKHIEDAITQSRAGRGRRWHLGSMNDGRFVIDQQPYPSNDGGPHDWPNGPDVVLNVVALSQSDAQAIVDAHNATLAPSCNVYSDKLARLGYSIANGHHFVRIEAFETEPAARECMELLVRSFGMQPVTGKR